MAYFGALSQVFEQALKTPTNLTGKI